MKRAVSLLLAVCLVAVLIVFGCTSAFAAADYTLTFDGTWSDGTAAGTSGMWSAEPGYYSFHAGLDNRFALTQPFEFASGYWYSGCLSCWFNTGLSDTPVTFTMRLSLGDDLATFTRVVTTQATSYGTAPVFFDFDFFVDRSFSCSVVQIELSDLNFDSAYISQIDASFHVTVESDSQHQSSIIGGKIDSAASNILSGEGLSGTSGVGDSALSGTASGISGAEDAINDALGDGGLDGVASRLDSVMDVELNDSILASFSAINTLFTRIVDTLDLTIVLTFLLVFALAMYVVGRRTS